MPATEKTYVLVHGAFHGGWCWRDVARGLRKHGHQVFTPTLTGLGERAHLRHIDPDLDTHIADVVQTLFCEELENVVLVGHSYAGAVITGVADCMVQALRHLVFLDALVLPPDRHVLYAASDAALAYYHALSKEAGGSGFIPAPPAEFFGVEDPERIVWMEQHLCPHPLASFMSPLRLANPPGNGLPVTYIRCTSPRFPEIDNSHARALGMPGWNHRELAAGHDPMVSAPEELIAMLAAID